MTQKRSRRSTSASASKPEVLEVTYSRLSTFLVCPMLEYYHYRAGTCGVESTRPVIPFIEGELGHYALHHFHQSDRMLRANMLDRVEKIVARLGPISPELDNEIRVRLAAITGACLGYKVKYRGDRDRYEHVLIETPFAFDLGEFTLTDGKPVKVVVRGRIDRFSKDEETKRYILWENKFVSGVTAGKYDSLPLDLQTLIYCEAVKKLTGRYPDEKTWDFIIKSRLKLKQTETLASFEARVQQQYTEEPDKMFFRPPPKRVDKNMFPRLKEQLGLLMNGFLYSETPMMNFSSCLGSYGRPCPFIQACTAKLQGEKDGWNAAQCQGLYHAKKVLHPELEPEAEEEKKGESNAKKVSRNKVKGKGKT